MWPCILENNPSVHVFAHVTPQSVSQFLCVEHLPFTLVSSLLSGLLYHLSCSWLPPLLSFPPSFPFFYSSPVSFLCGKTTQKFKCKCRDNTQTHLTWKCVRMTDGKHVTHTHTYISNQSDTEWLHFLVLLKILVSMFWSCSMAFTAIYRTLQCYHIVC